MAFRKYARVQSVAFATLEGESFKRVAAKDDSDAAPTAGRSYYVDGVKKIDVRGILLRIASKYAISSDPADYIYEAIRANTTNIPNENHDGFHKFELLRHDLIAGKPVYRTYEEKPHHVNHRTDNPKTARGVIVDAHYFDETPPLEKCPGCDAQTKLASQRDTTGIHCRKCGTAVRDEFVEILVAVDTKKDPLFANAVKTGQLCAGSMGCNCASTTCNVCQHVAYSTSEFCDHIRRGNKGTLWMKAAENGKPSWKRVEVRAAATELSRRARRFIPSDFCSISCDDGFEIRKAFEYCNQVEFDEYSRVDQPADPKALQREILKAASSNNEADVDLELETRALILKAELNEIEAKLQHRTAQMLPSMDVDADMSVNSDMDVDGLAILGPNGEVQPLPEGSEVVDEHDQGVLPGQSGQGPGIEELTQKVSPGQPGQDQQWTPEALGILPKASKEQGMSNKVSKRLFDRDYGDFYAEVTAEGNAVIVSKAGAIMTVTAGKELPTEEARVDFGKEVLASIMVDGIVDTVRKFEGSFPPRFAQILDAAVDDMEDYGDARPEKPAIADMVDDRRDNAGRDQVSGLPAPTTDRAEMDMENMGDPARKISPSTIGDRIMDREDAVPQKPESLSAVGDQTVDMRNEKHPSVNLGSDNALDGATSDMRANAGAGNSAKKQGAVDVAAAATRPAIPAATTKGIAEQWQGLDHDKRDVSKGRHLDVATYPHPGQTAFQQGHQKTEKDAASTKDAASEALARQAKLNESRIASIQKEADERVAAAEATLTDRFLRAVKIVARRETLNLEESPFKAAMFEVLANEQVVGQDQQTGDALVVGPISADLSQHYVEKAFQLGAMEEIERLVQRAAELMKSDPAYIASAESDLQKQAAVIPTMTSRDQLGFDEDEVRAEEMRRTASNGNLHLAPAPEVDVADTRFGGRRAELSEAMRLGASKTNQFLDLIQVRPN